MPSRPRSIAARVRPLPAKRRIWELLRTLAASVAATSVVAGCSDAAIDIPDDFTEDLCVAGSYNPVDGLKPSPALAYASLRNGTYVGDESGTLCGDASDKARCTQTVDEASTSVSAAYKGWGYGDFGPTEFFLGTREDTVVAATDRGALVGVLGAVDTLHEAALLARVDGYRVACGTSSRGRLTSEGADLVLERGFACGRGTERVQAIVHVGLDGALRETSSVVVEKGDPNCAVGRRPGGTLERGETDASCMNRDTTQDLGAFLAKIAELEGASVVAFAQLERELAHHHAPARLLRRIRTARRDEVRHTATMRKLAEKHGGSPVFSAVRPTRPVPSLETLARENLVEGCLRETYGALVAAVQATRASDPRLRSALAQIAIDEAAHAELSWEIHRWAQTCLDFRALQRLKAAIPPALATLRAEAATIYAPAIAEGAGMPGGDEAVALVDRLARGLFAGSESSLVSATEKAA